MHRSSRRRGAWVAAVAGVAAIAVAAAAACGSASEGLLAGGGGPFDSSTADQSSDVGSADGIAPLDAGTPPTALFVQASPSLPDVRLCWGLADDASTRVPFPAAGAMPGSNYPGIPRGGAAALSELGDLVTGSGMTLYAIDAENLARLEQGGTQHACSELVCLDEGPDPSPPCLRPNEDYWTVAPLASPLSGGAYVVTLAGCLGTALDPLASAARCGPGWSAIAGNLHAEIAALAPGAPADAGQLVVQAALLSPALVAALADDAAAVVSFGPDDDAGATPVATLSTEGQIAPGPTPVAIGAGLAAFGSLGFAVDALAGDGGAIHAWMSLAQAQQLVDPTEDPTAFFGQPRTYLVAIVGDPSAPHAFASSGDAGYDGTGLHLLVLPSPAPPLPAGGERP